MRKIIVLCCTALCLASCGTYKEYSRPETDVADLFGEEIELCDSVSIAALSWREMFTDARLQELIDTGLANNPDLVIATLRVEEAEAALRASRLAYLPSVSFTSQGQKGGFNGISVPDTYSLALTAEWELDIAGRLTNEKRGALASANMARASRQAVRTRLVATIANSYYSLLMLDSQIDVSRRTLESWDETLRTLQAQKNVGEATEAAVAQAKASRLAAESALLSLERQLKEQENALSVLIGRPPCRIERGKLESQEFPEEVSVGLPVALLDNRPDIRQAEYSLQAAFYSTNAARGAFYPKVTLSGTLGWANSDGSTIVNPGKWLWNVIGALTQPLFNRGRNKANLEIAEARQKEAMVSFCQSLLKAGEEVNNALTQWQVAQKKLLVDRLRILSLRDAVSSTQLLLKHSDRVTYLEVLTAQQTLLQAELAEKQDMFDKIQGVINLYHALGGGEQ